jgi:uncharacterized membrane protein YkvA (DUF1232 family)
MASERASAFWDQASSWTGTEFLRHSADDFASNEETVRHGFWTKLKRVASRIPFVEDLLAAYYCAFDNETPFHVKAALIGALAYFVLPLDGIPDILPLLGFADDAAVLATALRMVSGHIKPDHYAAAKRALSNELAGRV